MISAFSSLIYVTKIFQDLWREDRLGGFGGWNDLENETVEIWIADFRILDKSRSN